MPDKKPAGTLRRENIILCFLLTEILYGICLFHHAAAAAGTASAAGAAACAVAAAGGFSRLPVADHAADQQACDQHDDGNKNDID